MGTLRQRIILDAKDRTSAAFGRAGRNMRQLQTRTLAANQGFRDLTNNVGNLASILVSGVLARRLILTSNALGDMANQLRLVTDSTDELIRVQGRLFDVANETYSNVFATGNFYARLARSTRELGLSSEELVDITRSVSQAVAISGSNAQEANAGLIQLAQGLASNRLQGDELRSVLENLQGVSYFLAKGLGITRGELRKWGEEGKLTSAVVVGAFKKMEGEIADWFTRVRPTISHGWEVLTNSVVDYINEVDRVTDTSDSAARAMIRLGKAISGVADDAGEHFEELAKVGGAVFLALGSRAAVRGFLRGANAIRGIGLAAAGAAAGFAALNRVLIPLAALSAAYALVDKFWEKYIADSDYVAEATDRVAGAKRRLAEAEEHLQTVLEQQSSFPEEKRATLPALVGARVAAMEAVADAEFQLERAEDMLRSQQRIVAEIAAAKAPLEITPDDSGGGAVEEDGGKVRGKPPDLVLGGGVGEILERESERLESFLDLERKFYSDKLQIKRDSYEGARALEELRLTEELERIAAAQLTQDEEYALQQAALQNHYARMAEIDAEDSQRKADLRQREAEAEQEKIDKIAEGENVLTQARLASSQAAINILGAFSDKSKKVAKALFLANKAHALAETWINTQAAMALARATLPPPFGEAVAAQRLLAGKLNMAAIVATAITGFSSAGGGGGSSSGSSSSLGSTSVEAAAPVGDVERAPRQINITLERSSLYTSEMVRELVEELNKAYDDGVEIRGVVV